MTIEPTRPDDATADLAHEGTVLARSAAWDAPGVPVVSVMVSTWNRSGYLEDLHRLLAAQTMPHLDFEVVIVDNGSADDTATVLQQLAARSPLRLSCVRLGENRGPAGGRNAAARHCRGPLLAVTDDDCLPTPQWLAGLVRCFDDPTVAVTQGRVIPDPARADVAGPWDHTVTIARLTPFFETCNIAYRTDAFHTVGGFDENDPLLRPRSGRAFGEDTLLGTRLVIEHGRRVFADDAVVHHRLVPGTFRDQARDQRHVGGMPGLAKRSPVVADALRGGLFLSDASLRFDVALLGLVAAVATRRPWLLLLIGPWVKRRWPYARSRARRGGLPALRVLGQYAILDATTCVSLLEGSVRHRRPVL